ncbi:MAG: hypothetical protein ACKV0T_25115 [Planctomycetales bacterium]
MRARATLITLVVIQNAVFLAICITQRPEDELLAMIYVSWMIIPTLTLAIGTVNQRWAAMATAVASAASIACWDYLLIVVPAGATIPGGVIGCMYRLKGPPLSRDRGDNHLQSNP